MPDYADLQSAIASWIARDDLTTVIPTFISLCETEINRLVRTRSMEATTVAVPGSSTLDGHPFVQMPDTWQELRSIELLGQQVIYVTPEKFDLSDNILQYFYTIRGTAIVFCDRCRDLEVVILYFLKFTPLTDSSQTNWLTNNAYDLLLYGSLKHAEFYMRDFAASEIWKQKFLECVANLNQVEEEARFSGQTLTMNASYG